MPDDLKVERVDAWVDTSGQDVWAEGEEAALFLCADGRWAVLEGWEDTTGHGCQCDSAVSFHETRELACRLGLSDKGRELLGLDLDGSPVVKASG